MQHRYICYAECVIEHHKKFLVITRPGQAPSGGFLAFPGGKLEPDDGDPSHPDIFLNAAKREVLEEVGIALKDQLRYVTSHFFYDKDQTPVVGCVYYCKVHGDRPSVTPNLREVPKHQWLTREEINSHPHSPPWIKRYLSQVYAFDSIEIVKPDKT